MDLAQFSCGLRQGGIRESGRGCIRPQRQPGRHTSEAGVADGSDPENNDSEPQLAGAARERCGDRRSRRDSEHRGGQHIAGFLHAGCGGHNQSEGTEPHDRAVNGERLRYGHIYAEQAEGDPRLCGAQTPATEVKREG